MTRNELNMIIKRILICCAPKDHYELILGAIDDYMRITILPKMKK